jgi:FkbM family methyltransferase
MFNYSIPDTCTHCKLDVGLSYSAPQSQSWLSHEDSTLMVFGFEPNPESVACIMSRNNRKQHASHGDCLEYKYIEEGRFVIQPCALSNVDIPTTMKFYVSQNDCGTSSLYPNNETQLGKIKSVINVPVYSLKMFFDGFPWDRFDYIDYLKIDAQGSDLNILKSAGSYLRKRVVYVTAEGDGNYYIGAGECSNSNIVSYMETQGFTRIRHPNTTDLTFVNNWYIKISNRIYIKQS